MHDTLSICSDDTEQLLSAPSTTVDEHRNYINRTPDKFDMTEKYIQGIAGNVKERSWNYNSDSVKSPFIPVCRHNNVQNENDYGSNNRDCKTSNQNFSSSTYLGRVKTSPPYITSTLTNKVTPSYCQPKYTYTSYTTPKSSQKSKAVKFEDSLGRNESNGDNIKYSQTAFHNTSVKADHELFRIGDNGTAPNEDVFDEVDEKVKEGKEILQRLLKSTETKSSNEIKRYSTYTNVGDGNEEDQSFTATQSLLNSSLNDTREIIERYKDLDVSNDKDKHFQTRQSSTDEVQSLNVIKSSLSSSLNETNEIIERCRGIDQNEDNGNHFKDPILMSTRIDVYDERPDVIQSLSGSSLQDNSEHQSILSKKENERALVKLSLQVKTLTQQKETLEHYINQLKSSLTKKNEKCLELQEQLHKKLSLIHQLTTTDDKESNNLKNEVNILQSNKKNLEMQLEKMEESFRNQFEEIKDLERRFKRERQNNMEMLSKKEEEILSLHHQIEVMSVESNMKDIERKSELETHIENAHLRGRSILQAELEEMKVSLDNEIDKRNRLQSKHKSELNHLKTNFENARNANVKLKQELEETRRQNQNLEKCDTDEMCIKGERDEALSENDILKRKLTDYERIQKSMALELIEQSTKLAIMCGTSHSSVMISPPEAYVDCNIMSEAMKVFKEHLESFWHYAMSLRNDLDSKDEPNEDTIISSGNGKTSAKLLRHLQNRVQQLRKENAMLQSTISEGLS